MGTRRRLDRDLEVVELEALEQLDLLHRRRHERSGGVGGGRGRRWSGSEPEFAPMRSGVHVRLRLAHDRLDLRGAADVAGVDAHGGDAGVHAPRSASEALKWMSAMIGSPAPSTIAGSASASGMPGTATRTMSTPASRRRPTCSSVASTSYVLVVVIDWMLTGAPPPIAMPPTLI